VVGYRAAMQPGPPVWNPANSAESALRRCQAAADNDGFLNVLCFADLFLPGLRPEGPPHPAAAQTPARPPAGPVGQRLLTTRHRNRTYLAIYTSPEAMYQATGDLVVGWHLTNMGELTARWPDDRWGLAVNPGLSMGGYLDREQVAELGRVLAALPPFRPSGPLEQLLHTAARNADLDAYLILLSQAPILVGRGAPAGPPYRIDRDDRGPLVAAYTSAQRVAEDGGDPQEVRYTDLAALARDWPDPGCRLVVNRGSAVEVIIDGGRVPVLPGELAAVLAAAAARGAATATGAAGTASAPAPGGRGGPPAPEPVPPAAAAQGQIEVAVEPAVARNYLASGTGLVSGRIAAAGATDGAGYRVRWREADPASGIQPGINVRRLPLPPGAVLVRAEDTGEQVVASYHTGPDRWVATEPGTD
jgi:SseB protein N-terminal domain